jgi:hypothetical protein
MRVFIPRSRPSALSPRDGIHPTGLGFDAGEQTMPKFEHESHTELPSAFFERRRIRRVRMIVELTLNLISSDRTVSHREARCLVQCARKAVLEQFPGFEDRYDRSVQPQFDRILQQRWPDEELPFVNPHETVN